MNNCLVLIQNIDTGQNQVFNNPYPILTVSNYRVVVVTKSKYFITYNDTLLKTFKDKPPKLSAYLDIEEDFSSNEIEDIQKGIIRFENKSKYSYIQFIDLLLFKMIKKCLDQNYNFNTKIFWENIIQLPQVLEFFKLLEIKTPDISYFENQTFNFFSLNSLFSYALELALQASSSKISIIHFVGALLLNTQEYYNRYNVCKDTKNIIVAIKKTEAIKDKKLLNLNIKIPLIYNNENNNIVKVLKNKELTLNRDIFYICKNIITADNKVNFIKFVEDSVFKEVGFHFIKFFNKKVYILDFEQLFEKYATKSDIVNISTKRINKNTIVFITNFAKYDISNKSVWNLIYETIYTLAKRNIKIIVGTNNNQVISQDKLNSLGAIFIDACYQSFITQCITLLNIRSDRNFTAPAIITLVNLASVAFKGKYPIESALAIIDNQISDKIITRKVVLQNTAQKLNKISVKILNYIDKINNKEYILKKSIIGQNSVINNIINLLKKNIVVVERTAPLISYLLIAPNGYGKMYLINEIHKQIYNDEEIIVIDLAEETVYSKLESLHIVKTLVIRNLENIRKKEIPYLVQILKNGELVIGLRKISFKNSLVFFTTSIGTKTFLEDIKESEDFIKNQILNTVRKNIDTNILHLIDGISVLDRYQTQELSEIARIISRELNVQLSDEQLTLLSCKLKRSENPFSKIRMLLSNL